MVCQLRQHEAAVLGGHRAELLEPLIDHLHGVRHLVRVAVDVAVERRVVEQPLDRHLGERTVRRADEVRDVVAHQAAVVGEPELLEQGRRARVQAPRRRAVPDRTDAEPALVDVELLLEDAALVGLVEGVERLVDVAVAGELVAGRLDRLDGGRVVLDGVAGHEPRGLQVVPFEQAQDARRADARAEAALLHLVQAGGGLVGVEEDVARLGVLVEREHHGALRPIRPAVSHRLHSFWGRLRRRGRDADRAAGRRSRLTRRSCPCRVTPPSRTARVRNIPA